MPWVLEMSVNPSRDLRDRSCEPCDDLNPLGAMCCGMCAFWVRALPMCLTAPKLAILWNAHVWLCDAADLGGSLCMSCSAVMMCCCVAQENGRSQSALEKRSWDGPCNERMVAQLLQDLKGWGVDLESFQPKDLFDTIKGRTLWCAPASASASLSHLSPWDEVCWQEQFTLSISDYKYHSYTLCLREARCVCR